jgi:ubiquinone/menaquinone biosynthesis C-methylase UbiE
MDLGKRNQQYWNRYEAGTTPGVGEVPPRSLLEALPPEAVILDAGTGTGKLADSLASLSFAAYGIDINENEIAANSKRATGAEYSVQDIASHTTFPNNLFDLVIFRYTLTNIHRDQWPALSQEVRRIVKPGGCIWLAEPHVNNAYAERYQLGSQSLGDKHALYVFKDKDQARRVTDRVALQHAQDNDEIARIVRHYDEVELQALFPGFRKVSVEHVEDTSPSGYPLDTVVMTLQKTI